MKKLFLSLMLVAGLAAGFTSCNQKNESDTHSQTFTLGETSYHVDNAITIQNIQYQGSDVYNTIVLSQGQLIGETGGEGQGVVILFKGKITAGTYTLSAADEAYPKYFVAEVSIEDIVDFDIENYEENEDVYMAFTGSFTLDDENGKYVITTDGIEVNKYEVDENGNPVVVETATSSIDFEGNTADFVLATVEEGDLNGENIVTAGTTNITLMFVDFNVACFITEEGNFIGFESTESFANGLPEGEFTNSDYPIIMVQAMDIQTVKTASEGTISIVKNREDEDVYTIDMTATINGTDYTMHYVGTMPYFEIPM